MSHEHQAQMLLDAIERERGRQRKLTSQIEDLARRRFGSEERERNLRNKLRAHWTEPLKLEAQ